MNNTVTNWRANGTHWVASIPPFFVANTSWYYYKSLRSEGAIKIDMRDPFTGFFKDRVGIYVDYWDPQG